MKFSKVLWRTYTFLDSVIHNYMFKYLIIQIQIKGLKNKNSFDTLVMSKIGVFSVSKMLKVSSVCPVTLQGWR